MVYFVTVFACLIVLAILVVGVVSFAKGGDPHFRNKIMSMRVAAQAVALLIILVAIAASQ